MLDTRDNPASDTAYRVTRWSEAVIAVVTTTSMFALLRQLVFDGWAHSFDSAIYVRSLWGMANGAWRNPLVDLHVLSVHFNVVMFPLALVARVVHPATVLVLAQALAFGATVTLTSRALRRSAVAHGVEKTAQVACAWLGLALVLATPVVTNPFLFDVRPDLIGVPLALAGMLRARERGDWDVKAVALLLSSMLAREEYVMVVVGALATTPFGPRLLDRWRLRLTGMALGSAWFFLYFFGVRRWIGDGSFDRAQGVGSAFLAGDGALSMAQVLGYKAEIVVVFALSMALLSMRGWRWLGAALPGLLFVLINSRLQSLMLNFHYLQFAAPGLIVAAVHGATRLAERPNPRWGVAGIAAALVCFGFSSALPGGGRFREQNFALLLTDDSAMTIEEGAELAQLHELVRLVPPGVPTAVPWAVAADIANRERIDAIEAIVPELAAGGEVPDGLDWVVMGARDWGSVGRLLIEQHGFVTVARLDGKAALLTRDLEYAVSSELIEATRVGVPCDAPPVTWPALGLAACDAWQDAGGRAVLVLTRTGPATAEAAFRGVVIAAQPLRGTEGQQPIVLTAARGLMNARDVEQGVPAAFASSGPVAANALAVELWLGDQRVDAQVAGGETTPTVQVPLRSAR